MSNPDKCLSRTNKNSLSLPNTPPRKLELTFTRSNFISGASDFLIPASVSLKTCSTLSPAFSIIIHHWSTTTSFVRLDMKYPSGSIRKPSHNGPYFTNFSSSQVAKTQGHTGYHPAPLVSVLVGPALDKKIFEFRLMSSHNLGNFIF